jgi:hypothetical protein
MNSADGSQQRQGAIQIGIFTGTNADAYADMGFRGVLLGGVKTSTRGHRHRQGCHHQKLSYFLHTMILYIVSAAKLLKVESRTKDFNLFYAEH